MITLTILASCDWNNSDSPTHEEFIYKMITDTIAGMMNRNSYGAIFYTLDGEVANYFTDQPTNPDGRKLEYTLLVGRDSLLVEFHVWDDNEIRNFEWVAYYESIDSVASGYLLNPLSTGTRIDEPPYEGAYQYELLFVYLNSVIDYMPVELEKTFLNKK